MHTIVALHQDQGDREYQQDSMGQKSFGPAGTLCILADGMGGYEGGEIASQLIIDKFMDMSIDGNDIGVILEKSLNFSNESIAEYKKEHSEVKSMGSTAIAFFITNQGFQWVSVGDSPLYVVRGTRIDRINQNHSISGLLELQLKKGEITQKEFEKNPNKHMLTSAMTGEDIAEVDISNEFPLKENYLFILASDGIETLSENEINEIVQKYMGLGSQEALNDAAKALVDAVLEKKKPHQDNVSVLLVSQESDGSQDLESLTTMQARVSEKQKSNKKILNGTQPFILAGMFLVLVLVLWLIIKELNPTATSSIPPEEQIKEETVKQEEETLKPKEETPALIVEVSEDTTIPKAKEETPKPKAKEETPKPKVKKETQKLKPEPLKTGYMRKEKQLGDLSDDGIV